MRSLKPRLRITDLRQELDRLFDRVFESRSDEFPATGDWVPRLDLSENTEREAADRCGWQQGERHLQEWSSRGDHAEDARGEGFHHSREARIGEGGKRCRHTSC